MSKDFIYKIGIETIRSIADHLDELNTMINVVTYQLQKAKRDLEELK